MLLFLLRFISHPSLFFFFGSALSLLLPTLGDKEFEISTGTENKQIRHPSKKKMWQNEKPATGKKLPSKHDKLKSSKAIQKNDL